MSGQTLIQSKSAGTLETFADTNPRIQSCTDKRKRMRPPKDARERLIVALDVSAVDAAIKLVSQLEESVSFFKVGIELQMVAGMKFAHELTGKGKKVFWDGKWYDVPETVGRAVKLAVEADVSFLSVHDSGKTIQSAVETARGSDLKILAVTVLTSVDANDIAEILYPDDIIALGPGPSVEEVVLRRSRRALEQGCDGVIASGLEAQKIRNLAGDGLLIVTPGIRPAGISKNDHKRNVTPTEAIQAGADYLVVGRPIYTAPNPRAEAEKIIEEMEAAWAPIRKQLEAEAS